MQQVRQHVQLDTAMCSFGESASPMAFSEMARRKDNLQSLAFVGFPFLKKTSVQDLFCQIPFVTVILYRDVRKRQPLLFSLFQQISFPGQKTIQIFIKHESNMIIVISLKGELQRHLRLLHGSNIWETLFPSADTKIISQGRLNIQFSSFTVSHLTAQHLFQNLMRLWNFSLWFNWCFEEVSSYTLGFGVDVLILQSL